jgi:hypothetical protein
MRSFAKRPVVARLAACLVGVVMMLVAGVAMGHGIGMSQLALHIDGAHIEGEWEINLRDARLALGLDPNVTGEPAWLDLRAHEAALRTLLTRQISLTADSLACPLVLTAAPMEWHRDFDFVRLRLVSTCPTPPKRLTLGCNLLFDQDPKHRAYFWVEDERVTNVGVLRANERSVTMNIQQFNFFGVLGEFIREGIRHIWSGADHILFLLALLLPAPLVRMGNGWSPRAGLGMVAREVVKVVTAFTLAHSLTLCLSFFGVIRPPSQWVEVAIALSVFAAAWNNLRPFLPGRAWVIALSFGLVHGLGFAGALSNLSLPRHARLLALAAFNGGVELGQLAIVAVALPLLYVGSRRGGYVRFVMGVGSLGIAWLAVIWVLERAFGLSLFKH